MAACLSEVAKSGVNDLALSRWQRGHQVQKDVVGAYTMVDYSQTPFSQAQLLNAAVQGILCAMHKPLLYQTFN